MSKKLLRFCPTVRVPSKSKLYGRTTRGGAPGRLNSGKVTVRGRSSASQHHMVPIITNVVDADSCVSDQPLRFRR